MSEVRTSQCDALGSREVSFFFSRFLSNFPYKLASLYIGCCLKRNFSTHHIALLPFSNKLNHFWLDWFSCGLILQLVGYMEKWRSLCMWSAQQNQGARQWSLALQQVWWWAVRGKGLSLMSQDGKTHRCIASLSPEAKVGAGLSCPGLCCIVFCEKVLAGGHKADMTALLLRLPDQK